MEDRNPTPVPIAPPHRGEAGGDYDPTGVDLSLLRWFLGFTPYQRLRYMERYARDLRQLAEYGRRHRQAKTVATR